MEQEAAVSNPNQPDPTVPTDPDDEDKARR